MGFPGNKVPWNYDILRVAQGAQSCTVVHSTASNETDEEKHFHMCHHHLNTGELVPWSHSGVIHERYIGGSMGLRRRGQLLSSLERRVGLTIREDTLTGAAKAYFKIVGSWYKTVQSCSRLVGQNIGHKNG